MTKKEKKEVFIWVAVLVVVVLFIRRKAGGKTIDVSSDFLLEAYRDLIVMTNENVVYQGQPLHIYLARNTRDYEAVKNAYNSTYGGNFTQELTRRLEGQRLAEYVWALLENGQVITP